MRVRVQFSVEVPEVGATLEQVEDWLRFEFRDIGELSGDNPLINCYAEPVIGSFYCPYYVDE